MELYRNDISETVDDRNLIFIAMHLSWYGLPFYRFKYDFSTWSKL